MHIVRSGSTGSGSSSPSALHTVLALTWHAHARTGVLPEQVEQPWHGASPSVDHVKPATQDAGGSGSGSGGGDGVDGPGVPGVGGPGVGEPVGPGVGGVGVPGVGGPGVGGVSW